jgi:hypothetical protein
MGRLDLTFCSVPFNARPDWGAAHVAIDALDDSELRELFEEGDILEAEHAASAEEAMPIVRQALHADVEAFRAVALDGYHGSLTRLNPPGVTMMIAENDNHPFNDRPDSLYEILERFRRTAILVPAGFHDLR